MNKQIQFLIRLLVWFPRVLVKTRFVLFSFSLTLSTGYVYANPTGGDVVSGSASISSNGNRMDINQGSDRAVINWQDFSIGGNEQVNFNQPGRRSVALNRVVGANISDIQGQLTANGNVFIINRNGVVFGPNSRIDVNGLMATTSDIDNADFMAGRMNFTAPGGAVGSIVNNGTISVAEGGLLAFVAPHVRNAGVINARLGRVELAAGEHFTLDLYGDDLIKVAVSDKLARQLVENSGEIIADGGVVSLTAMQAKSAVDNVINMSGSIQARSVAQRDGKIILSGGEGGVQVAGTLDSSSESGVGGAIDVLGSRINLSETARVNVNGSAGGGEVHIGGDFQGKGARTRAQKTQIKLGAQVLADATANGDGGRIIVWSDIHTNVEGTLNARGGNESGDGGLIETSSAGKLDFNQRAKVEARGQGLPGTWLLDPEDITIGSGQANAISGTLNNGGNVSIKTADQGSGEGNIKVNAPITKTAGGDASLAMQAHNNIDVNAPITSTSGKLNVRLNAGRSINVNAKVSTNGGGFSTYITGVKPQEPEEDTSDEASADDAETQDESTSTDEQIAGDVSGVEDEITDSDEEQIADATQDPQVEDLQDTTYSNGEIPLTPESDIVDQSPVDQSVVDQPAVDQSAVDQSVVDQSAVDQPAVDQSVVDQSAVDQSVVEQSAVDQSVVEQSAVDQSIGVNINETVSSSGGNITIDAGNEGSATINSNLNSSNTKTGKVGGEIEVLGHKVVLTKNANLDASGDAGGGDVKVGGAYQGKGDTRTAQTTTVNKGATIKSNAISQGDGGEVVVWADKTTDYQGHIEAKGGAQGGDGGSVEVSGKQNLKFNGTVDTSAAKGKTGTLLLDPTDLTITNTGSATDTVNVLDIATINSLGAKNSVNVQVTEDIVFARFDNGAAVPADVAVRLSQTLGKTVAFKSINGSIVFANPGDTLETSGANLEFDAGDKLTLGNLKTKGGKVDLKAGGDVSLQMIDTRVIPNSDEQAFKGGDIIVLSEGEVGVSLNGSLYTATADINLRAENGEIKSLNKDVVLDTSALVEVESEPGTNIRIAGGISLVAKKIKLQDKGPGTANIIATNYQITATENNGDRLVVNNIDSTVEFQYISDSDPAIQIRMLNLTPSLDQIETAEITLGNETINIKPLLSGIAIYNKFLYKGGRLNGTEFNAIKVSVPDGNSVIGRPDLPPPTSDGPVGLDNCPPCIVVVRPDTPESPMITTPTNFEPVPDQLPPNLTVQSIASSAEIDRDSNRTTNLISENDGKVGGNPEADDKCEALDTLKWLESGPRDATSSMNLGQSSVQSSQNDIARMADCLTLDSQALL